MYYFHKCIGLISKLGLFEREIKARERQASNLQEFRVGVMKQLVENILHLFYQPLPVKTNFLVPLLFGLFYLN